MTQTPDRPLDDDDMDTSGTTSGGAATEGQDADGVDLGQDADTQDHGGGSDTDSGSSESGGTGSSGL